MMWAVYFTIQMMLAMAVQNMGITTEMLEDANFTFNSLYLSGIFSLVSLTWAQMKVSK